MFNQTWKKYLPVIIMLMKRSAKSNQVLNMNYTDFQRAAGGRKIRFTFSDFRLDKGRLNSDVKHSAIAMDLYQLLQENQITKMLIRDQHFEFDLNPEFQLTIKDLSLSNTPGDQADKESAV